MTAPAKEDNQILVPGDNCWKVEQADQVSFLIDADAYFYAFRESAKLARKNIFICGWDIDSRTVLLRGEQDDYPLQLGEFLNALAAEKDDLQIYIMVWDFVRFMGIDREWFSQLKLGWRTPRNIHFQMDQFHPVGASVHHKVVIIDDTIAFVGGLDLTKERWDTTGHRPEDSRRKTFEGNHYRPHHDVQAMVLGDPARSLGAYIRERWQVVTGEKIPPVSLSSHDGNWPRTIEPDIRRCRVGISRTRAKYEDLPGIYEAEKLYLDSIDKARDYIYIENQYLAASKIIEALSQSLQQEHGPEVIIVLPYATDGWLSQSTMDAFRARAVRVLREADNHGRLRIYYAHQDGLEGDDTLKIHSKLMIIDDRFVRIGSSNLNNRSMGFDTECDLAVELEEGSDAINAVRKFRNELLGEHLGVNSREVREAIGQNGSILESIENLRGNSRSLENLEGKVTETAEVIAEEQELFDPERPIEPEKFVRLWMPVEELTQGRFKYIQLAFACAVFIGLAAAWRFSPLQEFISMDRIKEAAEFISGSELAWLYVIGAYAIGSLLILPITLLITLTILVLGTYKGFAFAMLGAIISATITYWIGRLLGRKTVRSLAGDKINTLSRKLGQKGIVSTFIIRLVPLAPYSIVNIVAGASHIRFADFIIGTFLGMLPGTLALAGIIDRGYALIKNPDAVTIISSIGVIGVIIAGALLIRKKIRSE